MFHKLINQRPAVDGEPMGGVGELNNNSLKRERQPVGM